MRLPILKMIATLALWLAGCNIPSVAPQPVTPVKPQQVEVVVRVEDGKLTVNDATISVKPASLSTEPCPCCGFNRVCRGLCGKPGCNCSLNEAAAVPSATNATNLPQLSSALRDSKPVVEMLTDFDDGQCGACDLAWSDWKSNGKDWPFVLVKRRGTGGRTSPTFLMPGRESWSPQTYSVGGLLDRWKAR